MKLSLNKIFYALLLLQIISIQGILTFNIFKFLGKWELKSLVHPISLLLLLIYFALYILKKGTIKLSKLDILLFGYFTICSFVLFFNASSIGAIYISFREVFLISILIFIYQQVSLPKKYWDKILKLLYFLVIANLVFVALTHIMGPEKYMRMLTGRYWWPKDPDYKFKISSFLYFWRSPGLIGSAGDMGYFGLFTYLLFDQNSKYKKKSLFPILLAIVGFVRSVYVVLVVYWVLKFFLTKKNYKIIKQAFPYMLGGGLLIGWFLYVKHIFNLTSIYMRIDHWRNDLPSNFNLIFGGGIGEVGGAVRGEGFLATMDSYWLLMLISIGLVGIILKVLFVYEKALNDTKLNYALIGFLFAGLFITLTQSISFLVLFPILFLKQTDSTSKDEHYIG